MFQIDMKSRRAIYSQVADNFKRLITTGVLKPGEKVPSIRDLAKTLDVNPNTVQKAYRELESQGYFYTVLGQGNFIQAPEAPDDKQIQDGYRRLRELIRELLYRGADIEGIIAQVKDVWEKKSEGGGANDTDRTAIENV